MRSISLHVGVCRVAVDVVESVSDDLVSLLLESSTRIFSKREFVRSLRTVVNTPRTELMSVANTSQEFQGALQQINRFNHVVISQHAILGTSPELFKYKNTLPRAKKRVENLSEMFADRKISIHLAIAPQSDCLMSVLGDDEHFLAKHDADIRIPSWASLATNVRRACPKAEITVWDFDRPEKIRIGFLASMLNVAPEYIDALTEAHLDMSSCQELAQAKLLHRIIKLDEALLLRLDSQYEEDLQAISEIPNITLVGSG